MAKIQSVEKNVTLSALAALTQWQLQNAKVQLSEVIKRAATAPQVITVNGKESAVIVSAEEYQRLFQPKPNLVELLENSPLNDVELDFERSQSTKRRKVEL